MNNENNKLLVEDTDKSEVGYSRHRIPDDVAALIDERTDEDPDRHLIRLRLALPMNKRTNFFRVSLPNGGSAI